MNHEDQNIFNLKNNIQQGQRRALAQAITLVESQREEDQEKAQKLLSLLEPTNQSYQTKRIGVSGVPGAGKSTFIEEFGTFLCNQSPLNRVAVLALDPSSPLGGGSLLGDKTRMEKLSRHPQSFIRPSPTGGTLGGIGPHTQEALWLCESAGYNWIFIETVGVGQSEFEVSSKVDLFLLLLLPNAGDELQGMKKGILEITDLAFVNKEDSTPEKALETQVRLQSTLQSFLKNKDDFSPWDSPPILKGSALTGKGFDELFHCINKFYEGNLQISKIEKKRRGQEIKSFDHFFERNFLKAIKKSSLYLKKTQALELEILQNKISPWMAAQKLLREIMKHL